MTRIDYDELMVSAGYSAPQVNGKTFESFKQADEHFNLAHCEGDLTFSALNSAGERVMVKQRTPLVDPVTPLLAEYIPSLNTEDRTAIVRDRLVHWSYDGVGYVVTVSHKAGVVVTEKYARPAQVVARIIEIDIESNPRYCR